MLRGNAPELDVCMETIAKTMLAEGKAFGPTEGMMVNDSEGLAGGKSEDKAETLKRLLNRGLGPPAPQVPTADHCRGNGTDRDMVEHRD